MRKYKLSNILANVGRKRNRSKMQFTDRRRSSIDVKKVWYICDTIITSSVSVKVVLYAGFTCTYVIDRYKIVKDKCLEIPASCT